jgi:flagellar hook-associated protein 1 FlgK
MSTLSIGVTGLTAANIGLSTTSHNIANASTTGYNRQVVVQGTNIPVLTGAGFLGQGTNVQTVKRIYDQFLSRQVLSAQTNASEMDVYLREISQIDNLLADPTAGLSPVLSEFFKGTQEVAANPSSIPARQSMLSSAQALVARFQSLDQRMGEIREGINAQITSEVALINSYARQIADINQRIILARAGSLTQEPNDLLDQRDQLIADLNKEVRVTTVVQGDGAFNVFFGSGQPLVIGTEYFTLNAQAAADDPERIVIAMKAPGGTTTELPESQITGGTLGGLVGFRSGSLDSAQNALGRVAIALTQNFNDQHQLGQDLTGALGGSFFNVVAPTAYANSLNTSGALVTAAFTATAASDLTTSDYQLAYTAANTFTMTRLSDGTSWTGTGGTPAAALTDLLTVQMPGQGFDLTLTGTPNVGETFKIQPARTGAESIRVVLTDPRNIAAAAPMRSAAALANTGTGSISAGTVNPPAPPNANLQNRVTITFDNPPTTFDVFDVTAGVSLATNVAFTAGADITYNGWTVQVSGAPMAGDVFTVEQNSSGVSDNRNAVLLAALQTTSTMIGGTASYQSAYSQIVSEVGNKARQVETIGLAQQNLVDQAEAERQRMSGVNLDEEAANLLRYQQAYQASAKVIQIASSLFDELLAIMR